MLYGMEEFEYDDCGLMKKQKRISIKLVLLIVVAIIVCVFFAVFIGLTSKDENTEVADIQENETNTVEIVETNKEKNDEKKKYKESVHSIWLHLYNWNAEKKDSKQRKCNYHLTPFI